MVDWALRTNFLPLVVDDVLCLGAFCLKIKLETEGVFSVLENKH